MLRLPGMSIPLSKAESLVNVTPEESPFWAAPASAALDQQTGTLAVYSRGTVELLTPTGAGGRYESLLEERVIEGETEAAVLALGGQTCAVCRKDGTIKLLDAKTLKERRVVTGSSGAPPRAAIFSTGAMRRWILLIGSWQVRQLLRATIFVGLVGAGCGSLGLATGRGSGAS